MFLFNSLIPVNQISWEAWWDLSDTDMNVELVK